jgi:hypothetical protein
MLSMWLKPKHLLWNCVVIQLLLQNDNVFAILYSGKGKFRDKWGPRWPCRATLTSAGFYKQIFSNHTHCESTAGLNESGVWGEWWRQKFPIWDINAIQKCQICYEYARCHHPDKSSPSTMSTRADCAYEQEHKMPCWTHCGTYLSPFGCVYWSHCLK